MRSKTVNASLRPRGALLWTMVQPLPINLDSSLTLPSVGAPAFSVTLAPVSRSNGMSIPSSPLPWNRTRRGHLLFAQGLFKDSMRPRDEVSVARRIKESAETDLTS